MILLMNLEKEEISASLFEYHLFQQFAFLLKFLSLLNQILRPKE